MKRIFLFLILLSPVLLSHAQEISRQEADSMMSLLGKNAPDTDRVELLLNLAQFHIFKPGGNKMDLDTAATYIEEAKVISRKIKSAHVFQESGDLLRNGRSLELMSELYYLRGELDKAFIANQEALGIYHSVNYKYLQGIYLFLGRFYFYKHDDASALSNLLKALKAAESANDKSKKLYQINNFLGQLYNDIDRLDMAVKYLYDALQAARKNNDEDYIFHVLGNLSIVYNNLGQPHRSLKALDSIPNRFRVSKLVKDQFPINMGYLTTYLELKQMDKAHPFCDVILGIADNPVDGFDRDRRAYIYAYIAKFYFLSKQYAKARYYNLKSTTLAKEVNFGRVQMLNLEISYKLDSAEGNFRSAYNNLLLYKVKADSVSGERKIRQFQVMNVEYEVEMKEDSIKQKNKDILLLTQKNNLQQENLKQAGFIKNITGAGIILAFIFIGLLYRQYRQKQKSNQVIIQKNEQLLHLLTEKEWLVKEIHHRVKNNLQMVISLLNAQTEFLTHPLAIVAMKESRERMEAIAIIHQKLYQLDNSTLVNMATYVNDLLGNIKNSLTDWDRIEFKAYINDVNLDISQSLPLGLILNEAITNAIKYAFAENEKGVIRISLNYVSNDRLQLKIADNGMGLPSELDLKHSNSLGMKLIHLFSEQLEGDLYFINNNGLEIILNFKTAEYSEILSKITA